MMLGARPGDISPYSPKRIARTQERKLVQVPMT
ncbi:hypothetical protein SAMN05444170_0719 [Bradyrhizobium erythrophlei]|uniref:Uncharacterized protein n=1 Tax=Bradyrhizobium erythrophlei TaxID=1437360 RepID=A0A1M7T482_9BRAD|nr:hypothetical protein SAMN05444170_0719 [Bradyrhizobium erythrophlei]